MHTLQLPSVDKLLTFASGSHKSGFVENVAISDESDKKLEQHIKENGFPISRPEVMQAGDASWHYGWTLHSAPGNASKKITGEVITIIYFADGARVTARKNEHRRRAGKGGLAACHLAALALLILIHCFIELKLTSKFSAAH